MTHLPSDPRREAEDLVYSIDDLGKGVTDWEADFVDSIIRSLEDQDNWVPSNSQLEKLRDIHTSRVNCY